MYIDEKIKIFAAEIFEEEFSQKEAGEILNDEFLIKCAKGSIRPTIIQRQGKKVVRKGDN